jgi:hypothetical protein
MERSEILASMGELKLFGMRSAFDQIVTTAVKRQHAPQQVIGDFVGAEIAEKQARSINPHYSSGLAGMLQTVERP